MLWIDIAGFRWDIGRYKLLLSEDGLELIVLLEWNRGP